MAKKQIINITPALEKMKRFRNEMAKKNGSKEFLIGVDGCIELCEWETARQVKDNMANNEGFLNELCKAYERLHETRDSVNFGDIESIILDHVVASNNLLAVKIEELETCSPKDFKQMALTLAKKEL